MSLNSNAPTAVPDAGEKRSTMLTTSGVPEVRRYSVSPQSSRRVMVTLPPLTDVIGVPLGAQPSSSVMNLTATVAVGGDDSSSLADS